MPVPQRLVQLRSSLRWRRRELLLHTLPPVFAIVAAKLAIDRLGWEFISVSPLHTSVVAGAIFIIGLMLAGMMSDKEGERLPTETWAAPRPRVMCGLDASPPGGRTRVRRSL